MRAAAGDRSGRAPAELAPAARAASALEVAAERWIADYFNARHLIRTRDWLVTLSPDSDEGLRVAALTHDIERRVPGGPRLDPRVQAWDDAEYLHAHSARSADIVAGWLEGQGTSPATCARVGELISRHEIGGSPAADLLQAADSLSFLEVNAGRACAWVDSGWCRAEQARAKLDWMRDRIRTPAAEPAARRLHALASAALGPAECGDRA